jgi:hypothetical protein
MTSEKKLIGNPAVLNTLEESGLSRGVCRALEDYSIKYVGQLLFTKETDLLKMVKIGNVKLREINAMLVWNFGYNAGGASYLLPEMEKILASPESPTYEAALKKVFQIDDNQIQVAQTEKSKKITIEISLPLEITSVISHKFNDEVLNMPEMITARKKVEDDYLTSYDKAVKEKLLATLKI